MRFILTLALLLGLQPAAAQDPILRMDLPETEAIPGQSLSLRLTVLVPSFMPDPPVWPSFETPNLLVRVGSSGPTSEQIDGATWAGISRRYLITPMVPGAGALPPQELALTWADPDGGDPLQTVLMTDALQITGLVPEGAEDLSPFIAAEDLSLEEALNGSPGDLAPGDTVTRTVTARATGLPAIFLPELVVTPALPGLRAYPDAPVVTETDDRGAITGSRAETVTYTASGGGEGALPGVALDWFNLRTGAVETAQLDPVNYAVSGPPARDADTGQATGRRTALRLLVWALGLSGAVLVGAALYRRFGRRWIDHMRALWLASELRTFRQLRRAARARDLNALYAALDAWGAIGADPRASPGLHAALSALGAARYGKERVAETDAWRAVENAIAGLRRHGHAQGRRADLPALNPRP